MGRGHCKVGSSSHFVDGGGRGKSADRQLENQSYSSTAILQVCAAGAAFAHLIPATALPRNLRFAHAPFAEKSDIKPLTSQGLWAIISLCPVQGRGSGPYGLRSLPRKYMAQACAGLVFDKSNVVSAMVEFQCSQTHASAMLPSARTGVPGTRRACWGGVARRRV